MPPNMISHYQVVRRLGAGGMGEVFLAEDTQLDRPVALKLLPGDLAGDASRRKRFLAEAKAASALNHANVCTIYDVGETDEGQPFIAMEYLEGQTLDALAHQRRLELGEIVAIGLQVAAALEAAQQHQLVHRDIKPANLMMDAQGRVKVLDFGLAKRLDRPVEAPALTQAGTMVGTPSYLSPEIVLGREVDIRTDIFSLGVVLYELTAGQNPFASGSFGPTVNKIVNQDPGPLRPWNPTVTPEFERVVRKCLEKDAANRYEPAQLREDLAKLQAHLRARQLSRRQVLAATVVVLALGLAGFGVWWLARARPKTQPKAASQQPSLAVLPFVNLSGDKADDYLSDGMTEELLNALARVKGLRVPARTSCFAFKSKADNIHEIGEQLQVKAVLEGSLRRAGNQLRITAQLVNVQDGFPVWSETYDRDMTNIFAIQTDIASRVATALKVRLLGPAQEPTRNLEAYKLYLQGRSLWNRRTGETLKQAIAHFDQAIALDPSYALAYAGLADCYIVLDGYTGMPGRETFPKARAAALKALELDGSLAEPRGALAFIQAYVNWDWSGAEAAFRQTIESNPNYATAHHWLGRVLLILRRPQEALAEFIKAQEIDPLSPVINNNIAEAWFYNGQADRGIELLKKQVALDPSFVTAHRTLAWLYLETGKLSEFRREHDAVCALLGRGDRDLESLGVAQARAGQADEARQTLGRMRELQREGLDYRISIAMVEHALGDNDAALDSLEKAVEEHAGGLAYLNFSPQWEDLRPHPRFQAILRKMNMVK